MTHVASRIRHAVSLAALISGLMLVIGVGADAQTDRQRRIVATLNDWGILGNWSLDCSRPPSRNNGYLNYIIQEPGIAMHVRYFGDSQDSHEVLGARLVGNGALELTVRFRFKDGDQTRTYVMIKQDGRIRAISNVNAETGEASIRDGKFVFNGAETPWQTQCLR